MLNKLIKSVDNDFGFKLQLANNHLSFVQVYGRSFTKILEEINSAELVTKLIRLYRESSNELLSVILNSNNSVLYELINYDSISKLNDSIKSRDAEFSVIFRSKLMNDKELLNLLENDHESED